MSSARITRSNPRWAAVSALALVATASLGATALPASAAGTPSVTPSSVAAAGAVTTDVPTAGNQCPDVPPDIGTGGPAGFDSNVNIYVGGDWSTTESAAEAEGVVVVEGDATFDRDPDGIFNIGVVGVGSQVTPPPGSTMLHVGGNLTTVGSNFVQVGIGGSAPVGGAVNVGGSISPDTAGDPWVSGNVQTNGAPVTEQMGTPEALVPFDAFGDTLQTTSDSYAALPATGTTSADGYGTLTLTGDGSLDRQIFEIDLDADPSLLENATIVFENIDPDAVIVVNVTGGASGTVGVGTDTFYDGDPFSGGTALGPSNLGAWAEGTLWNFEDATDVDFHGTAQFIGSVVVPSATGTVTTSMPGLNGRTFVGGNLVQAGTGTEIHAYPFDDGTGWGCTGGITLTKIVEDPSGAVSADREYTGTYSCTAEGAEDVSGTWTLTAGQTVTLDKDLPMGAECTITENTPAPVDGGSWADPVISPEMPVTINSTNPTIAITVTNTFVPEDEPVSTGFEITKALDDEYGTIAADTTFSGAWECTDGGAVVGQGEWELAAGETVTVADGLPLGAECTVTESALDGGTTGTWQAPVIAPGSVTLNDATELTTVTVTNTYDQNLGALEVVKNVDDADSGLVPAETTYSGTYECTLGGSVVDAGTWSISGAGRTTVATDVPYGAECALTENEAPAVDGGEWTGTTIVGSPAIIGSGETSSSVVVVTNTFTPAPVGGFEVSKSLVDEAGLVPVDAVFSGTYDCTVDGVVVGSGVWSVAAGESVMVADDLPVGAECIVVEDELAPVEGGSWQAPVVEGSPLTVVDGEQGLALVSVTNTFTPAPVGGFEVSKSLVDEAGLVPVDAVFSGTYECTVDGVVVGSGDWSVAAGESVMVADDLPVGAECTVTEDELAPVEGGSWQAPVVEGSPLTVVDGEQGLALVSVTNTFTPAPVGGFEVSKSLVDEAGVVPTDAVFSGTYECTVDGVVVGSGDWSVAAGESVMVADDLPVGAECIVTEDELAPVEGGSWQAPVVEGSPLTVVDGEQGLALVSVTNTFTLEPTPTGTFEITKVLDDQTGLLTESLTYTGDWQCVLEGDTVAEGEWELQAGETVTVAAEIPVGAECTVTEDALVPSAFGEWQEPVVSGPITVEGAQTLPVVTVTNTLTPYEPEVLPTTVPSPEPTPDASGELPETGSNVLPLLGGAAFLLLAGAGFLVIRRRQS